MLTKTTHEVTLTIEELQKIVVDLIQSSNPGIKLNNESTVAIYTFNKITLSNDYSGVHNEEVSGLKVLITIK